MKKEETKFYKPTESIKISHAAKGTNANTCGTCSNMQRTTRKCCTNTKVVNARYNCLSGTCTIITRINRSRLRASIKVLHLPKILIAIIMVKKHNMKKYQQHFYKCKMCNNTFKITFILNNDKKII